MIKHIWTVLCKESTINQGDNVMSLFGVLEELTVTLTPINRERKVAKKNPLNAKINIPLNFELVSFWTRDNYNEPIKSSLEIAFYNPKGEELKKIYQDLAMPAGIKRFRSRMKISGITIQGVGEYCFKVGIKETDKKTYKTVSELPLEIKLQVKKPVVKS